MWTVDHLADLESDFAVFHRVTDPLSLAGPEFFRKAHRMAAYSGVLAARVAAAHERSEAGSRRSGGRQDVRKVSLKEVAVTHPDLIERG